MVNARACAPPHPPTHAPLRHPLPPPPPPNNVKTLYVLYIHQHRQRFLQFKLQHRLVIVQPWSGPARLQLPKSAGLLLKTLVTPHNATYRTCSVLSGISAALGAETRAPGNVEKV